MPLSELTNAVEITHASSEGAPTVEQTYQKLTPHQHILQRPDTYVGAIESVVSDMWVFDEASSRMTQRKVTYVPGLYKIFDEILVNAADNKQRDASMTELKVEIDPEKNKISVYNNGRGIPVVMHKEHHVYVPELIFGHLLTSSNYNDDQKKVTGGRNGYGAKLANIFSSEFIVETADSNEGKKYKQVFRDNMRKKGKPVIKDSKEDWTKITFVPDLQKFGMEALDADIVALMARRVYDMAGITHHSVKVFLNGKRVPVNNFQRYIDLYLGPKLAAGSLPRVIEKVSDRWEVCVAASDDGFQQISFVNAIATTKGGTHVSHVTDQVVEKILEHLKKKHKGLDKILKPNHVKAHLMVFINCLVENPAFDSQTKENMTLKQSAFGSKCAMGDKFFKDTLNCGVLESILAFAQNKQNKDLKKTDGAKKARLTGISKLDDANEAGGKNGYKCTLIITEGDSAKALAVSGLSVIGRDLYGVFPLRGKLLNVRDANHSTIMANKEISELKQILGLQQNKDYSDPNSIKTLRYGHLMLMTDQDHDGSHIKGLLINFIHCYWPSLLQHHNFLREFVTPIVKVSKGKQVQPFFTLTEYNNWREALGSAANGWNVKYYKGLGTSTSNEAKEYFSDLPLHELSFEWRDAKDGQLIELAFSKSMAEARKDWLRQYDPLVHVDHSQSHLSFSEFIDSELIHFSNADNVRSIPSMVDGLKPGQRKILFSCFKRGKSMIKHEIKVAQLAGYVSEHSAYHHGETSLAGTIVGMAQTFVGSNNIPLLYPSGQFGTRLLGGKDAASPRYIFTKLPSLTRLIFHPADDALLENLEDDGQVIEPKFYVPILPMVLVNGAEGIGTGWSSSVPMYNPRDIVANLYRMMDGKEPVAMTPWYRGFSGTIATADKGSYVSYGTVSKVDDNTLHISELPLRKWTQDYKDTVLEPMLANAEKAELALSDVREYHTDTTVSFTLKMADGAMAEAMKKGLHKLLKLSTSISTSNMTLFDEHSRIHKHETPESVLSTFYRIRLSYYEKRKLHLSEQLTSDWSKLDNKMRFVQAVIDGKLKIAKRKKSELVAQLQKDGYTAFEPTAKKKKPSEDEDEEEQDSDSTQEASARGYDYLLGMPLWSLTLERVEQLQAQLNSKEAELKELLATTTKQMWAKDLEAFLVGLGEWEDELVRAEQESLSKGSKSKGNAKGKAAAKPVAKGRSKKKVGSDSEDSDSFMEVDSDSDYEEKKKKKTAIKKKAVSEKPAEKPIDLSVGEVIAAPVPVAPKRKVAEACKPAPEPSAREPSAGSDDDDEGSVSLAERLMARGKAKNQAPSPLPKPTGKRTKEEGSPLHASSSSSPAAMTEGVAKRQRGGTRKAAQKKLLIELSDDDSDLESAHEDEYEPEPQASTMKNAAKPVNKGTAKVYEETRTGSYDEVKETEKPKPAPKPRAKKVAEDKEDDSDVDMEAPKAKAAPKSKAVPKAKAAPRAKKMVVDLDEDSDFEEDRPKNGKRKSQKAPKKPSAKMIMSDDSDYEEEFAVPAVRTTAPPRRAAAAAASKKYIVESDVSDSQSDSD